MKLVFVIAIALLVTIVPTTTVSAERWTGCVTGSGPCVLDDYMPVCVIEGPPCSGPPVGMP